MFFKNSKTLWVSIAILIVAGGFAFYVASHPMDFRVYHYGARGVFDGTRPVYGPNSGLGWPMHYRYPPLFLLLFAPLALLPLGAGAAVWVVLKVGVLVWLLRATCGGKPEARSQKPEFTSWWSGVNRTHSGFWLLASGFPRPQILPFLFIAPYLVEELRYGNAQFFVFALTAAALLKARERPMLSAATLALAVGIKVWPLFFVPYLLVRRDWKVVSYALVFVIVLTLLPSFYFGFRGNLNLLGQWFSQEFQTQLSESEIWFPNQSLRGVLMRYLTVMDYSQVPDSNYPLVHLAALNPATVLAIWLVLAGCAYLGFLMMAYRTRETDGWIEHGLAFGLLALLEPFTQKYALCVLLWPALAAGALAADSRLRILLYIATALALIQPLAPGAAAQRLLQVLGLDFVAAVLLMAPVALLHARTRSGRIL